MTNELSNKELNETWPVGKEFTITLKIIEEGAINNYMKSLFRDVTIEGCKVLAIYPEDDRAKSELIAKQLKELTSKFLDDIHNIG